MMDIRFGCQAECLCIVWEQVEDVDGTGRQTRGRRQEVFKGNVRGFEPDTIHCVESILLCRWDTR